MKKAALSTFLLLSVICLASKTAMGGESWHETAFNAVENVVKGAFHVAMNDAENSFIRSVSDHYVTPQKTVVQIRELGIPDEEIPVVFYLARQAKMTPLTIAELRLNGTSWQVITNRYGYGAEIFYVPIESNEAVGPPYGHAYGFYRNKPKKDWNKIMLEDNDIINLVNLKFISEHYKYPVRNVMKMRQQNKRYILINHDIAKQSKSDKKPPKAASANKAKAAPAQVKKPKAANKPKASVKKQKQDKSNPEHLTGTKKQIEKGKKFLNKKNEKAKKFINDKG